MEYYFDKNDYCDFEGYKLWQAYERECEPEDISDIEADEYWTSHKDSDWFYIQRRMQEFYKNKTILITEVDKNNFYMMKNTVIANNSVDAIQWIKQNANSHIPNKVFQEESELYFDFPIDYSDKEYKVYQLRILTPAGIRFVKNNIKDFDYYKKIDENLVENLYLNEKYSKSMEL